MIVSPEHCVHEVNGVKYFEYDLGSEDSRDRVARSKFKDMSKFAKSPRGCLALQGDHGRISFRNIKIRPIEHPSGHNPRAVSRQWPSHSDDLAAQHSHARGYRRLPKQ